jgi:hypothetical protein
MRASGLAIRQTRARPLAGEHCMALDPGVLLTALSSCWGEREKPA